MANQRRIVQRTPTRKAIWAKYGGRCAYCGRELRLRGYWQRDHVVPLVRYRGVRFSFAGRNGCVNPEAHTPTNIVAACVLCNKDKGSLDLETWRASLKWLGPRPLKFWFERYIGG